MKTANIEEKFSFFADLGRFVVPYNHVHDEKIEKLDKRNFYYISPFIKDVFCCSLETILVPGQSFFVKAFSQEVEFTTSEERVLFLKKQPGIIFPGVQGTILVFEQKIYELPKNFWYSTFSSRFVNREDFVPNLGICKDDKHIFGYHQLNKMWDVGDILLCFYKFSL